MYIEGEGQPFQRHQKACVSNAVHMQLVIVDGNRMWPDSLRSGPQSEADGCLVDRHAFHPISAATLSTMLLQRVPVS